MHAELESVREEKSYCTAFLASHMSSLSELDRTSGAISFSFKAGSHLQLHLRIIAHLTDCIVAVCTSSKLFTGTEP